jgi:hypothetical protein
MFYVHGQNKTRLMTSQNCIILGEENQLSLTNWPSWDKNAINIEHYDIIFTF